MKRSAPDEPDPRMAAFAREQAGLAHAQVPEGVAEVGTRLPDAELLAVDGSPLSLAEALGDGLSVLVFYRGAWCPYCNIALRTYQAELLPATERAGRRARRAQPADARRVADDAGEERPRFAVLSDPGTRRGAQRSGSSPQPSEEARPRSSSSDSTYGEVNADGTTALPMPTVPILDADLTIRWIDVHPDYTTRSSPPRSWLRSIAIDGVSTGEFEGRVALVTGAGRGIGRAITLALARARRARVAVLARTAARLDEVAARDRASGAPAASR